MDKVKPKGKNRSKTLWANQYRYVEAYVRLEAASLEKNARQGITLGHWVDQLREPCGMTQLTTPFDSIAGIAYDVNNSYASQYVSGTNYVRIKRVQTNPNYHKPYFECPVCHANCGLIILVGEQWACRHCHDLAYRSQFLSASEREALRLKKLAAELQPRGGKAERPLYMRQRKFAELWEEYQQLRAKRANAPMTVPHAGLQVVLTPHWTQG